MYCRSGNSKKKTGAQEKDKVNTTFNRGGIGNRKELERRKRRTLSAMPNTEATDMYLILPSFAENHKSQGRN